MEMAQIISITENATCIGFIINRGPMGFEAYTADEKSLGIYVETNDAVVMIWRAAHNQRLALNVQIQEGSKKAC
jgi:hypothetical protein